MSFKLFVAKLYKIDSNWILTLFRVIWFCNKCHKDVSDVKLIRKCHCFRGSLLFISFLIFQLNFYQFFSRRLSKTEIYPRNGSVKNVFNYRKSFELIFN